MKLAILTYLLGPHSAFVVAAGDTTAVDPKASVGVLAAVTLEAKVKSAPITTGGWANGVPSNQVCACGDPRIAHRVPDGSVIASWLSACMMLLYLISDKLACVLPVETPNLAAS